VNTPVVVYIRDRGETWRQRIGEIDLLDVDDYFAHTRGQTFHVGEKLVIVRDALLRLFTDGPEPLMVFLICDDYTPPTPETT
jgi:hypothetical protein